MDRVIERLKTVRFNLASLREGEEEEEEEKSGGGSGKRADKEEVG